MSLNLEKEVYIKGTLNMSTLSIEFNNTPVVKRALKKMANDELLVEVRVRPLRYIRSDAQNRYYWGVCVVLIMQHLGDTTGHRFSRDEVHQMNLKYIYGDHMEALEIKDPINGGSMTVWRVRTKSTSSMNTLEFTNFIEELRAFWLNAGCEIPEPEPEKDKNSNFLEDLELTENLLDE